MAILASDNFTRVNSADLGTAWDENTAYSEAGGFNILSNAAIPADKSADSAESNNAVSWPNDQYSQVTFGSVGADGVGVGIGPTCRAAVSVETLYRCVGNASGYELIRFVTGSGVSLSSGSGTTFATGNTLRLEVTTSGGNAAWVLKKNGTSFASGTDTSPIASGRAGIGHSSTDVGTVTITAWEGGDFSGGVATPTAASLPGGLNAMGTGLTRAVLSAGLGNTG